MVKARWLTDAAPAIRERDRGVTRMVTLKCRSRRLVPERPKIRNCARVAARQGHCVIGPNPFRDPLQSPAWPQSEASQQHCFTSEDSNNAQRKHRSRSVLLPRKTRLSRIQKWLVFERSRLIRYWHDRFREFQSRWLHFFVARISFLSCRSRRRSRRLLLSGAGAAATARMQSR